MFYSEYVLAKKGPLGKVWLAAHWNKKLTRAMIARSDVIEACQSIIKPTAPLALRTSGHLLLGVVRIHDSKQKSLMNDCSEALIKIKLAFRPGLVDLPISSMQASYNAITMAESFQDFAMDEALPFESTEEMGSSGRTGRVHEITLKEGRLSHMHDDVAGAEFGEAVPFFPTEHGRTDEPAEVGRDADATMEQSLGLEQSIESSLATRDAASGAEFEQRDHEGFEVEPPPPPPMEEPGAITPVEISLLSTPTVKAAAAAKRSKRKAMADVEIELKSTYIRQRLEPDGADDVTRTPYEENPTTLAFDRPSAARSSVLDESMEAAFLIPSTTGWAKPFRELLVRNYFSESVTAKPRRNKRTEADAAAAAAGGEDAEGGAMPPPPPPEFEGFEVEAPPMPGTDESIGGAAASMDASAASLGMGDISAVMESSQRPVSGEVTSQEYEYSSRSKRTQKMTENLRSAFSKQDVLSYDAMTHGQTRLVAAACLFELLVLATDGAIDVQQGEPYGDIQITATSAFPVAPAV